MIKRHARKPVTSIDDGMGGIYRPGVIIALPESKPVLVIDEEKRVNIARFATIKEAESYIGALPDQAKVERGGYGIDAPEEMING